MFPLPLRFLACSALFVVSGLFPPPVVAHSNLAYIIINGEVFDGFDPRPGKSNSAARVGWSSANPDAGYVGPANFTTPEIACHLSGAPAPAHAPVRAGDKIHVQWNGWPFGHPGPVLSYLAPCEGTSDGCASVDKTKLLWTKIDDSAPAFIGLTKTGEYSSPPGEWASHIMINNNNSWSVHVPSGLRPGPYVLRHEAIALHFAKKEGGAQHYPLCINLWVEPAAAGTKTLPFSLDGGVPATKLYKANDPGVLIDVFQPLTTYVVPGPSIAANAEPVRHAMQTQSVAVWGGKAVKVVGTRTAPFVAGRTPAARSYPPQLRT